MKNNFILIIEIIWITTGLLCLAAGIRYAMTGGSSKIPIFALMAFISFFFAFLRHRQRKKS